MNFLTKKCILYFFISVVITFIVGFYCWNIFVGPNSSVLNKVLAEVNKIKAIFFTASLSKNYEVIKNTPINLQQDSAPEEEILDSVVLVEDDTQNQLDDIQEKIDIIKQKVNILIEEQNQIDKLAEEEIEIDENITVDYPKILISEVQSEGGMDSKEEFVELYNPNSQEVDLTGWLLQRKTAGASSWSTYALKDLFLGKKIPANGYFLISRNGYYAGNADIFTDNPITNDNSFVLKNPNGDVSDKLGFGNAIDPELIATVNPFVGLSIGRKLEQQDTDNNLADFEIQQLTPETKNMAYAGPPPIIGGGGGGGGGGTSTNYPKILISEVQISPIDKRFIEFYNPNNQDVDLTNWYLQRKISSDYTSFITKNNFLGKIIPANGYFLISRSDIIDVTEDIIILDLTLTQNNFLALKNPNGDISDEMNFTELGDNKTIGRKVLEDNTEQDTDDSLVDFELQTPTPKAQNITYSEPPTIILKSISITIPATKLIYTVGDILDITGLEITGTYSDESTKIETIITDNIAGFDSTSPIIGQVLTITLNGQTITYTIDIIDKVIPKNILINEIQIEGDSTKDDWLELYNPNDFEIDISNWSIQRTPRSGSIYKKNFEADDMISANSYFLIVRNDAAQKFLDMADMVCSALQLSSGSTVYLVKKQSEILGKNDLDIVDKVGWGDAYDYELNYAPVPGKNQSIIRTSGVDTDDNSIDFTISEIPTPKAGP
jgi:predicted extracellular nuclease